VIRLSSALTSSHPFHQCDTWAFILTPTCLCERTFQRLCQLVFQCSVIRRSVTRPVLQPLVESLVLTRLDFGCTTFDIGQSSCTATRLQSLLNAAARLVYSSRRSEHVSLHLHWLRVPLCLAVLVHRCFNGTAPRYLASQLERVADTASRRRLRSASSPALHVPRSLHKTIGDRAFPVAAAKVCNNLPPAIMSLSSLHTFKSALKTELFRRSYGDAHYRPPQR